MRGLSYRQLTLKNRRQRRTMKTTNIMKSKKRLLRLAALGLSIIFISCGYKQNRFISNDESEVSQEKTEQWADCAQCGGSGFFTNECSVCDGSGRLIGRTTETRTKTCPSCYGTGISPCNNCQNYGYIVCSVCSGNGSYRCKGCNGTGVSHVAVIGGEIIKADCGLCNGTGYQACLSCGGKGRITCHDCYGQGHKRCLACNGSGGSNETYTESYDQGECPNCNGSGRTKSTCGYCDGEGKVKV